MSLETFLICLVFEELTVKSRTPKSGNNVLAIVYDILQIDVIAPRNENFSK